jgi:hypothetical protein
MVEFGFDINVGVVNLKLAGFVVYTPAGRSVLATTSVTGKL